MLTINNISKSLGGRLLFKNLGYTIGDYNVIQIKGSNGSGKSTLLKIISGILSADQGEILYAGEKILGKHYSEYCDIIQYLGHKLALKNDLSVYENIAFWANLKDCGQLIEASIEYFELYDFRDYKIKNLSAGWQKRVALAKVMACHSEMWILDEPYVNLDERGKTLLNELIKVRCREGGVAIIASHENIDIDNIQTIEIDDFAP